MLHLHREPRQHQYHCGCNLIASWLARGGRNLMEVQVEITSTCLPFPPPPSHDRKKFRLGHRCRRKYAADATRANQRQPFDSLHAFTLPVSKTLHCFFIIGARGNNKGSCCIQVINWLSHFSPCGESWQAWCSLNC